jgi:hypothetical protein
MKKAVIVVGAANTGKSTTIREFKKLVKMLSFHIFTLDDRRGYILSCSFEEAEWDVDVKIKSLSDYDFLVLASQGTELDNIRRALNKEHFDFENVNTVLGEPLECAKDQAKSVLVLLRESCLAYG